MIFVIREKVYDNAPWNYKKNDCNQAYKDI
jgi:hypothetical protein